MAQDTQTQKEAGWPRIVFGNSNLKIIDSNAAGLAERFISRLQNAGNEDEMEELIFSLKLTRPGMTMARMEVLRRIFDALADPCLLNRARVERPNIPDEARKEIIRLYREKIGRIAIEVFFDAVFECDKENFWRYLTQGFGCQFVSYDESDAAALIRNTFGSLKEITSFDIKPHTLLSFLNFFVLCNYATKSGYQGKIRKFLKCVLDKPLEVGYASVKPVPVSISKWSKSSRGTLACALVANGMYEECIEYDLSEAKNILAGKFVGKAFVEQEDGSVQVVLLVDYPMSAMSVEEAMQKACADGEWRHIWSVLSIMEYKYGHAHFVRTIDPTDPRPSAGIKAKPKLALMFDATLERKLEGF